MPSRARRGRAAAAVPWAPLSPVRSWVMTKLATMARRLFLLALVACAARPPAESPVTGPELALVNVRIEGNPGASAIAMADGRITAIGGAEVAAHAKNVRDLAGATVWPGLRDAHVHL